jgi:hypothetical protein
MRTAAATVAPTEEVTMSRFVSRLALLATIAVCGASLSAAAQTASPGPLVSERIKKLTRAVQWKQVAAIPVNFNTFHPQGMVKIGDTLFVSSVDIRTPTKRYPQLTDGYDRDTGEGAGHLFKLDLKGNLIADLTLGEGSAYHPGGFEIVDLAGNRPIFQVPVELWTESGLPMTQNPFWVEPTATGLRAYFMPEDEKSTLYIYEADVK